MMDALLGRCKHDLPEQSAPMTYRVALTKNPWLAMGQGFLRCI